MLSNPGREPASTISYVNLLQNRCSIHFCSDQREHRYLLMIAARKSGYATSYVNLLQNLRSSHNCSDQRERRYLLMIAAKKSGYATLGQQYGKSCATRLVVRRQNQTAVALNQTVYNSQTKPRSGIFRGKERIKNL